MRASIAASPPSSSIHSAWSAMSRRLTREGVFSVWFAREFFAARDRSRMAGTGRCAASRPALARAAGEAAASQSPPSAPKHFCGEK